MNNKKTKLGIDENIEALLCYAGAFITGIIFLILEKDNKYVRFHAMQSLVTFLGLFIISTVISIIPVIGVIISALITPLGIVLWLFMMYKAYNGEIYKLPFAGDFSEKQIFKENTKTTSQNTDTDYQKEEKPDTEKFDLDNPDNNEDEKENEIDKNL